MLGGFSAQVTLLMLAIAFGCWGMYKDYMDNDYEAPIRKRSGRRQSTRK